MTSRFSSFTSRALLVAVLMFGFIFAVPATSPQTAVFAQEGPEVFDVMTISRVERILNSFGDITFKEIDTNVYQITVDNTKMILKKTDKTLLLYCAWSGKKMSLNKVNEWNKVKRFAKAYIDNDGDPVLESDYLLSGGVTEQSIKEWMKLYVAGIGQFRKFMDE